MAAETNPPAEPDRRAKAVVRASLVFLVSGGLAGLVLQVATVTDHPAAEAATVALAVTAAAALIYGFVTAVAPQLRQLRPYL